MTLAELLSLSKATKAPKARGEVSFTTKDGRTISFTPKPKVPHAGPLSPYAEFVRDHIHAHHDRGLSWPEAMKAVAKQYKRA